MDRPTVLAGQTPLETDILRLGQFAMVGDAALAGAILGSSTALSGFAVAPTAPASLSATVGPGTIFQQASLEASAWSSLPADTLHTIVKQGIALDPTTLTFTPPTTVNYAINYLIQAQYQDVDTGAVVRPYYNAANPAVQFQGPGGAGTADNTTRKGAVALTINAGVAATAGSQTTPPPAAGTVGFYVVTVAYGQTTVTQGNIAPYPGAPFILVTLPNVPTGVQSGQWEYGTATGTNAYAVSLTPAPASLPTGMEILVSIGNANTSAASPTLAVNGGAVSAIVKQGGGVPIPGDLSGFVPLVRTSGGAWSVNGPVASDVTTVITNNFIITTAVTKTIGTDFATLAAAFAWVSAFTITTTGSVTFNLPSGQITAAASTTINLSHPNGNRIFIQGAALKASSPVPNSFAASGNSSTARGNDRASNITLMRAIYGSELLCTGGGGIVFGGSLGGITNVLVSGDTTTGTGLSGDLITVQNGIVALTNVTVGAAGGRGILVTQNGFLQPQNCSVYGCLGSGWSVEEGGRIVGSVTLNAFGNGGNNVNASGAASIYMDQSLASGTSIISKCAAGNAVSSAGASSVNCGPSAVLYQSQNGAAANDKSFIKADGANSYANSAIGFQAINGSTISALNTISGSANGTFGYLADVTSNIYVTGGSATGSTGAASPAVNTVGNHNSFITQ